jgi:hypothetical protein
LQPQEGPQLQGLPFWHSQLGQTQTFFVFDILKLLFLSDDLIVDGQEYRKRVPGRA